MKQARDVDLPEYELEDRRKKKAADEVKEMAYCYQLTFSTPHGIRVLQDLFRETGLFNTSFTGNSVTFFNEGKRNIGLYLLQKVDAANLDGLKRLRDQRIKQLEKENDNA